jgi:hypothetical protein
MLTCSLAQLVWDGKQGPETLHEAPELQWAANITASFIPSLSKYVLSTY